jgi:hypothetical protein
MGTEIDHEAPNGLFCPTITRRDHVALNSGGSRPLDIAQTGILYY